MRIYRLYNLYIRKKIRIDVYQVNSNNISIVVDILFVPKEKIIYIIDIKNEKG
jgi:hypothetical protein